MITPADCAKKGAQHAQHACKQMQKHLCVTLLLLMFDLVTEEGVTNGTVHAGYYEAFSCCS